MKQKAEKIVTKNKQVATEKIPHSLPLDVKKVLAMNPKATEAWNDITPLAKNEWICWIISAKQEETRNRRIRITQESLSKGKRRPCCWAGCPHR